jgi:hypothetical protein
MKSQMQTLTLVQLATFAERLQARIGSLSVRESADPAVLARVHDEVRAEVLKGSDAPARPFASGIAGARVETIEPARSPAVDPSETRAYLRLVKGQDKHVVVKPVAQGPARKKAVSRRLSPAERAARAKQLAKAREGYFRKMGFGKFAKRGRKAAS